MYRESFPAASFYLRVETITEKELTIPHPKSSSCEIGVRGLRLSLLVSLLLSGRLVSSFNQKGLMIHAHQGMMPGTAQHR